MRSRPLVTHLLYSSPLRPLTNIYKHTHTHTLYIPSILYLEVFEGLHLQFFLSSFSSLQPPPFTVTLSYPDRLKTKIHTHTHTHTTTYRSSGPLLMHLLSSFFFSFILHASSIIHPLLSAPYPPHLLLSSSFPSPSLEAIFHVYFLCWYKS